MAKFAFWGFSEVQIQDSGCPSPSGRGVVASEHGIYRGIVDSPPVPRHRRIPGGRGAEQDSRRSPGSGVDADVDMRARLLHLRPRDYGRY